LTLDLCRKTMSDAGDEINVDAPAAEVEVTQTDAPKGKLTVEEALQVRTTCNNLNPLAHICYSKS